MGEFLNKIVVLDVDASYVYIGTLKSVSDKTLQLGDADVHDLRDSATTRERYILDTKLHGLRTNRSSVYVSRTQIVSFSLLNEILT